MTLMSTGKRRYQTVCIKLNKRQANCLNSTDSIAVDKLKRIGLKMKKSFVQLLESCLDQNYRFRSKLVY